MMSMALATQRLNALKNAENRATNPEFKELWKNRREELIKKLQSGNSYDERSGELLC